MSEIERVRARERGAPAEGGYEALVRHIQEINERQEKGKVVIKPSDRQWELCRQGRILFYLNPLFTDTALDEWYVFIHDIRTHSGKHRHQGGLALFVLEGEGYSTVNGERVDWEKGDLILLPLLPEGVEHQHFNRNPGKPCRWLAFIHAGIFEGVATELTQTELSPEYQAGGRDGS
jgi:mannose-6-phosphate isomerase-like protein (cupin superfamily)